MHIYLDGKIFLLNLERSIMFKYEKDMIPILGEELSKLYNTKHFFHEFDSGNGVADIVLAVDVDCRNYTIVDYDLMFVIMNSFNRMNKKIKIKEFLNNTFLNKKKAVSLLDFLETNGYTEKIDTNYILIKSKYTPPIKQIISIEAKLSDWKSGFYQALRYKVYSHKSYLAISDEYAHRVDKDLLIQNNIGLIIVSEDKISISIEARSNKPSDSIAQAYLSEKMADMVFA